LTFCQWQLLSSLAITTTISHISFSFILPKKSTVAVTGILTNNTWLGSMGFTTTNSTVFIWIFCWWHFPCILGGYDSMIKFLLSSKCRRWKGQKSFCHWRFCKRPCTLNSTLLGSKKDFNFFRRTGTSASVQSKSVCVLFLGLFLAKTHLIFEVFFCLKPLFKIDWQKDVIFNLKLKTLNGANMFKNNNSFVYNQFDKLKQTPVISWGAWRSA